jgi:hypothetical protein
MQGCYARPLMCNAMRARSGGQDGPVMQRWRSTAGMNGEGLRVGGHVCIAAGETGIRCQVAWPIDSRRKRPRRPTIRIARWGTSVLLPALSTKHTGADVRPQERRCRCRGRGRCRCMSRMKAPGLPPLRVDVRHAPTGARRRASAPVDPGRPCC